MALWYRWSKLAGKNKNLPPYQGGPRREMTDAWKESVRQALAANASSDIFPANQSQLVRALGALHDTKPPDRTAITKMWNATASTLVDDICAVLKIPPPLVVAPPTPPPEPEVVEIVRRLPVSAQADVLDFVRRYVLPRTRE